MASARCWSTPGLLWRMTSSPWTRRYILDCSMATTATPGITAHPTARSRRPHEPARTSCARCRHTFTSAAHCISSTCIQGSVFALLAPSTLSICLTPLLAPPRPSSGAFPQLLALQRAAPGRAASSAQPAYQPAQLRVPVLAAHAAAAVHPPADFISPPARPFAPVAGVSQSGERPVPNPKRIASWLACSF